MSIDLIRDGVRRFRTEVFPKHRQMYQALEEKQQPFALFLTCGDSRIDPSLLTGTQPGQIFVERTPGNIVPVYDDRVAASQLTRRIVLLAGTAAGVNLWSFDSCFVGEFDARRGPQWDGQPANQQ